MLRLIGTRAFTTRKPNRIAAVYFDMCGTIVDDKSVAPVEAFSETFRSAGVKLNHDEIRQFMGVAKYDHVKSLVNLPRVQKQLNSFATSVEIEDRKDLYSELYQRYLHFQTESARKWCQPIRGVSSLMHQLKAWNIKVGTTSGFPQRICNVVLENFYRNHIYNFSSKNVLGSDSLPYNNGARPKPGLIFELMSRQKIKNPRSVIKVGDTVADIQEGKNAGTWVVAVTETSSDLGVSRKEYNKFTISQKEEANKYLSDKFYCEGADFVTYDVTGISAILKSCNFSN